MSNYVMKNHMVKWALMSWIGVSWAWIGALQVQAQSSPLAQAEPVVSDEFCIAQNSQQQDEQTILGNLPDSPYVVVVPGQTEEKLTAVRQCVPDAFQTDSRLGAYIQVGTFADRRSANRLSRHLRRSLQLDARVMYWP